MCCQSIDCKFTFRSGSGLVCICHHSVSSCWIKCRKIDETCEAVDGVKEASQQSGTSHYSSCVIFLQSAHYLHEEAARYPRKIHYHNPPDLAMEALEVCSGLQCGGHYCSKGRAIFEKVFECRLGEQSRLLSKTFSKIVQTICLIKNTVILWNIITMYFTILNIFFFLNVFKLFL